MPSKMHTYITVSGNFSSAAAFLFCLPVFWAKFRVCLAEKFGQSQLRNKHAKNRKFNLNVTALCHRIIIPPKGTGRSDIVCQKRVCWPSQIWRMSDGLSQRKAGKRESSLCAYKYPMNEAQTQHFPSMNENGKPKCNEVVSLANFPSFLAEPKRRKEAASCH